MKVKYKISHQTALFSLVYTVSPSSNPMMKHMKGMQNTPRSYCEIKVPFRSSTTSTKPKYKQYTLAHNYKTVEKGFEIKERSLSSPKMRSSTP